MTKHIRNAVDLALLGRRRVLGMLGASGALLVVGCGDSGGDDGGSSGGEVTSSGSGTASSNSPTTSTTSIGTSGGEPGTSTGEGTVSGDGSSTAAADCDGVASAWASGGTAAMTAKDCYPDPFAGGVLECALICETTAGPCTADTIERQDVSEGFLGLPVRLALLVVDADTCAPVPDAIVEIWHTQRTGVYSGVTPNPQMCYGQDPSAATHLYFRGTQTAGADGRVDFDTCFPGWYNGRAIHIHFRVTRGGDEYVTSQLFFAEDLISELFSSHSEYKEFGQPNTTNDSDNIIGGEADKSNYLLTTARMPDGAMLASKVIAIRSSPGDDSCSVGGGGGMPIPP